MEINRTMTKSEIEDAFDQEWVLVNDPEFDEQDELVRGTVRYHCADRDEFDQAVKELRSQRILRQYFGAPREDLQFLL